MMRKLIGLALSAFSVIAGANSPGRSDFAYEVPIALQGSGSVYRAALTANVYRGVTRTDLGDLRIFNAAGEAVAHELKRPATVAEKQLINLPLYSLALKTEQSVGDVSMKIERGKDGSIINVHTGSTAAPERLAYFIDASQAKQRISALEFTWDAALVKEFMGVVRVEASADLKEWRPLTQGALAHLTRGGHELVQKRIVLPRDEAKYLRLSWIDATNVALLAVTGELHTQVDPQRDWSTLQGTAGAQPGEYRFVLDGKMPVDAARLPLPENSIARVTLLSRDKDGDPWELRGTKTVYLLKGATGAVADNEIRLSRSASAREWRLVLDRHSNAFGATAPALELGWTPHDAVFVARGDAPFVLAYGNATARPVSHGVDDVVRRLRRDGAQQLELLEATLGAPLTLRGEAARTIAWYQGDWKQWTLWAVLVLGVGILGMAAARLVRQLSAESTEG